MKIRFLLALIVFAPPCFVHAISANSMADLVRAQIIIGQAQQAIAKIKEVQAAADAVSGAAQAAAPAAPAPLTDGSGKFFSPYDDQGNLTEWANKALTAQVGSAVGAKAGEKAGQMVASKIPFAGGLLAMGAKKKGKELGALAAVGGADFVKKSSSHSFRTVQDLALHLHVNCADNSDYIKAFAAAMALYPELEKTYESTVKGAYGGH